MFVERWFLCSMLSEFRNHATFHIVPRIGFQTLLTCWCNMLVERWLPPKCSFTGLSLWHFRHRPRGGGRVGGGVGCDTSTLVKHDAHWKMSSPQDSFPVAGARHPPYVSPHRFSNTSHWGIQDVCWKMVSPKCRLRVELMELSASSPHTISNTPNSVRRDVSRKLVSPKCTSCWSLTQVFRHF